MRALEKTWEEATAAHLIISTVGRELASSYPGVLWPLWVEVGRSAAPGLADLDYLLDHVEVGDFQVFW
jgi:hypothetical protein